MFYTLSILSDVFNFNYTNLYTWTVSEIRLKIATKIIGEMYDMNFTYNVDNSILSLMSDIAVEFGAINADEPINNILRYILDVGNILGCLLTDITRKSGVINENELVVMLIRIVKI